uniref:Multiple PDZ domain protein n=1 Tax=Lygus hesperus TaxID=30085 RepID=A0A0A9ZAU5_LYGHE
MNSVSRAEVNFCLNSSESDEGRCRTVMLERGIDGLGFSIVGGYGSLHGNLPIYVKTVYESAATVLKRGDRIVAVDHHNLNGLTHQQAVQLLTNSSPTVSLTIHS